MLALKTWEQRFRLLDTFFVSRLAAGRLTPARVEHAWNLICSTGGGGLRVSEVAVEVGWGRRQLWQRFSAEYGLTPKEATCVVRFDRAHKLLRRLPNASLAEVAAHCGYYDQPHMAREWKQLAGRSPSGWIAEELPFIQGGEILSVAS